MTIDSDHSASSFDHFLPPAHFIRDVESQQITASGSFAPILSGSTVIGIASSVNQRHPTVHRSLLLAFCRVERVQVLLEGNTCLATMSNSCSYIFHSRMGIWMRVADRSFSRSAFHSQFRLHPTVWKESLPSLAHRLGVIDLIYTIWPIRRDYDRTERALQS